ncbi:hypothetical protein LR48_Vigan661s002600 [Vigna angularis]|uniref:Aminotransferase-like plant mobile domain-containing protein n=1 Tax=Phaseolus angularis TaxID=3914 RepID=A0A0L9TGX7_PHAAN|nr:hypothetical protein LR48_Vigan661s002600 [Vigna angularis]
MRGCADWNWYEHHHQWIALWNDRHNRVFNGIPFQKNGHLRDESEYMQWYITHTIRYIGIIEDSTDEEYDMDHDEQFHPASQYRASSSYHDPQRSASDHVNYQHPPPNSRFHQNIPPTSTYPGVETSYFAFPPSTPPMKVIPRMKTNTRRVPHYNNNHKGEANDNDEDHRVGLEDIDRLLAFLIYKYSLQQRIELNQSKHTQRRSSPARGRSSRTFRGDARPEKTWTLVQKPGERTLVQSGSTSERSSRRQKSGRSSKVEARADARPARQKRTLVQLGSRGRSSEEEMFIQGGLQPQKHHEDPGIEKSALCRKLKWRPAPPAPGAPGASSTRGLCSRLTEWCPAPLLRSAGRELHQGRPAST